MSDSPTDHSHQRGLDRFVALRELLLITAAAALIGMAGGFGLSVALIGTGRGVPGPQGPSGERGPRGHTGSHGPAATVDDDAVLSAGESDPQRVAQAVQP